MAPTADGDGCLSLELVGGFRVVQRGHEIPLPRVSQRVVALVALADRALSRSFVGGTLWAEAPEDRALGSLRSALSRIRDNGCDVLELVGDSIRVRSDTDIDVLRLRRILRWALQAPERVDDEAREILVCASELLPDWPDDWIIVEREQLQGLRIRALECLSGQLMTSGRFSLAFETAAAAVAIDPLRESAHRALIRIHLAEGNPSEALRQYLRYRQCLRDELDLRPSSQMEELVRDLASSAVTQPSRLRNVAITRQ